MHKLGITLPHLGGTQVGLEILEAVQNHYADNWTTDISLFHEEVISSAFQFPCAAFPCLDLSSYDGPVIATSLRSAAKLLNCVTIPKKWFYVFDLEWIWGAMEYSEMAAIYRNPKLELIARSDEYADYIKNAFNCKVNAVMTKFEVSPFLA